MQYFIDSANIPAIDAICRSFPITGVTTNPSIICKEKEDLKKILGIDPLKITLLKCGTFEMYEQKFGTKIRTMNPEGCEINDLLNCHLLDSFGKGGLLNEWI